MHRVREAHERMSRPASDAEPNMKNVRFAEHPSVPVSPAVSTSHTSVCTCCQWWITIMGTEKAAHRHLLSSLRRGSCRDRSRYLGQAHIPLTLRCQVCSAEPRNWSELQQHLAEHLCDVFKNDVLRYAFLGQARKSQEAPQGQSGERGGGRAERTDRPMQWQRQVGSTTNPLAQSRASPKQSAQTLKKRSRTARSPHVHAWVAFLRWCVGRRL